MAAASAVPSASHTLEPEAFRNLYPDLYFDRFLENGIRPDGRAFGGARPVTIGPDAVGTADASALVKLGNTTVLSGLKFEVLVPSEADEGSGQLVLNVELTPMCYKESRYSRSSELAACCAEQVKQLLLKSKAVDLSKLAIPSGKTAWVAYLDIYILNLDGGLLDVCLLAAVASLASLKSLPSAVIGEDGQVRAAVSEDGPGKALEQGANVIGLLNTDCIPLALTCGFYKDKLIVDPTAEEESLMQTLVTTTVTASGRLVGLELPGGEAEAGTVELQDCIAATSLRFKEVWPLLEAALQPNI